LIGAIFVNAAGGRSITVFLQERAFEKNLAASPATIAIAATKRQLCDDLFLPKICADEATELAVRLTGAESGILDRARATGCGETFFQRVMSWGATLTRSFHKVRCEMLDAGCQFLLTSDICYLTPGLLLRTSFQIEKWRGTEIFVGKPPAPLKCAFVCFRHSLR
jgi:hypothetical protein